MPGEGLKLVIGGDVKEAEQALKKFVADVGTASVATDKFGTHLTGLEKQVTAFGGGVKKFSASFSNSFNVLPPSIKKVDSALSKLPNTSNAATLSLINLGRVAQDAPFGFLGIANNLNPLLESFQRLKQQSGSTGGALKALGGSLMGAGGLGFALSIASSLLIVFGDKLFGIGGKASKTNEEIQETAERLKALARPLSEVRESAVAGTTEELAKVGALSKAVLDQTKSYDQRNNALNQLKKINESYFGDLTLETSKLGVLKERVDEYTKAIIAQAVVKGFSDEIGKLSVELDKQERAYNQAGKALNDYNKKLADTKETSTSLTGEERISGEFVAAKKAVKNATSAFAEQGKTVGGLRDRMFELRNAISEAVESSLDFRPLEITKSLKGKDTTQDFINKAKQLAEALENIGFVKPADITALDSLNVQLEKARKIFADFKNRDLKIDPKFFKIEPTISEPRPAQVQDALNSVEEGIRSGIIIAPKIPLEIEPSFSTNALSNFSLLGDKELADAFRVVKIPMSNLIDFEKPAGFNLNVLVDTLRKALGAGKNATRDELIAIAAELQKGVDNINGIIKNIAVEGISSFAQSFGTLFAGGDLKNVFSGFVNVLADGLSAIGKQMIALSPVIASLKQALKSLNPAILLPAGVALVAIGAALRSTVGKGVAGFAQGGLVFGPTMGMVGEGLGTSRSNPEVIAPLDQLKGMLADLGGAGVQHVIVTGRLRGRDQILQNARTTRSQRRLGVR